MSDTCLVIEDVRYRYGAATGWELAVPSLRVRGNEVLGIIGPNGSGKSTLLRIAAGALRPLSGMASLEGRDLARTDRRWIARRLGHLPQAVASQFDYRVDEVVAMGRYAHLSGLGALGPQDVEAIDWSLAATDTDVFRARRLSQLSGGERQRVFLASVLAQQPGVLLLDEPTRHLDIHHQVGFFRLLRKLARDGMAIAAVTHDLNLAALFCDRIFLLHGGRPFREGRVEDVLCEDVLKAVYGPDVVVGRHPLTGRGIVLPADEPQEDGTQ